MVTQNPDGLFAAIEKKLGLPPIPQLSKTIQNIPDVKTLRLLKDVIVAADSLSSNKLEFDKIEALINQINSMPLEKLKELDSILKRIERILKTAPQELLGFLTSLK